MLSGIEIFIFFVSDHLKTSFLQCIALSSNKLRKMRDNNNNVHFSGKRFILRPCLVIKLALASLRPIIT